MTYCADCANREREILALRVERDNLRLQLNGSEDRAQMILNAKSVWLNRAVKLQQIVDEQTRKLSVAGYERDLAIDDGMDVYAQLAIQLLKNTP